MKILESIYKLVRGEAQYAWQKIVQFFMFLYCHLVSALGIAGRHIGAWATAAYKWVLGLSLATKVFIVMAVFLAFFLFWQFMAYNVSQPVFVMVNLLLVIIAAAMTCVVIFIATGRIRTLRSEIMEQDMMRKKKDQEIINLKREIHDLNIATRKQMSFGKNSQVLIDTVKKNRKLQVESEAKGLFILKSLAQCADICCGVIYMKRENEDVFDYAGEYATKGTLTDDPMKREVTADDAIFGQVIQTGKLMTLSDLPTDSLTIMSGLGETETINVTILPIKKDGEVVALAEVASFSKLALAEIWKDIDNVLLDD